MSTQTEEERRAEDLAIAEALERASHWVDYVTCIEAIAQPSMINDSMSEKDRKNRKINVNREVSSNYVCRRCNRAGHHISKCITNGDPAFDKPKVIQRVCGIPQSFIKTLSAEGMLRISYFIHTLSNLFLEAKQSPNTFQKADGTFISIAPRSEQFAVYTDAVKQAKEASLPPHIACGLCKNLIKIPITFPCCTSLSYCKSCIMLESGNEEDEPLNCPICHRYVRRLFYQSKLILLENA